MRRSLRVAALVFGIVAWLLLSPTLTAAPSCDQDVRAFEAAGIYLGSTWTPRISIARSALDELRDRMVRHDYPTGLCIMGPFAEDYRAPGSLEEAWHLEKLYGRSPRWVLQIVALDELASPSLEPGELFYLEKISGISVGVLTSKTVSWLNVELLGDSICVFELDA